MTTLDILLMHYGPTLDTWQLKNVFKYASVLSVRQAIHRRTFPVKTFRIGSRRVASSVDVAAYLDNQRAAAA